MTYGLDLACFLTEMPCEIKILASKELMVQ